MPNVCSCVYVSPRCTTHVCVWSHCWCPPSHEPQHSNAQGVQGEPSQVRVHTSQWFSEGRNDGLAHFTSGLGLTARVLFNMLFSGMAAVLCGTADCHNKAVSQGATGHPEDLPITVSDSNSPHRLLCTLERVSCARAACRQVFPSVH